MPTSKYRQVEEEYVDPELKRNFLFYVRNNEIQAARRLLEDVSASVATGLANSRDPSEENGTMLILACAYGYEKMVDILLGVHADATLMNGQNETALMEAVKRGEPYKKIVPKLLPYSAAVIDAQDEEGETALIKASRISATLTKLLLEAKASPLVRDLDKQTPLMHACQAGHIESTQAIISSFTDPKELKDYILQEDAYGDRALAIAANGGNLACVELLLQYDQDVAHQNDKKETALMFACLNGYDQIAWALLKINPEHQELKDQDDDTALIFAAREGHKECVRALMETPPDLKDTPNKDGATPIMLAAQGGFHEVVRMFLEYGANTLVREVNTGKTALIYAAHGQKTEVIRELVKFKKEKGVDIGVDLRDLEGDITRSAVEYALEEGCMEIVSLLLEAGAQLDTNRLKEISGADGVTPLMQCAGSGNTDLVECLLEAKVDVDLEDLHKRTALIYAARNGVEDCVEALIKSGADVDITDENGNTALHFAVHHGHSGVVSILLEAYAKINIKNDYGWTPLHHAAHKGNQKIVRALLDERGCNVHVRDEYGLSPLEWAAWKGQSHLFSFFQQKMDKSIVDELEEVIENSGQYGMIRFMVAKLGVNTPYEILCQLADNPVHSALCFSLELGAAAEKDKLHPLELSAMSKNCIDLAITLLDSIPDPKKKQQILRAQIEYFGRSTEEILPHTPSDIAKKLAVEAGKFFAYPAVQDLLEGKWRGHVEDHLVKSIFKYPFKYPFSFFSRSDCFFGTPRGKFWLEFIFYLSLLSVFSIVLSRPTPFPTPLEIVLYVLIFGFITEEFAQVVDEGFAYFESPWNAIDIATEVIFLVFFGYRMVGVALQLRSKHFYGTAFKILSCNAIFLWIRLLNISNLHPQLGPLMTIVKMALKDIYYFLILLGVVMLGFSQTLYASLLGADNENDFGATIYMLFRSMMGDLNFMEIQDSYPVVGPVLAGIFLVIASILILNLLIARFSSTYEQISSVADYEFQLSKAKTYLDYAEDRSYIPPPLNLIPLIIRGPGACGRALNKVASAIAHLIFLVFLAPFAALALAGYYLTLVFSCKIKFTKKKDEKEKPVEKKAKEAASSLAGSDDRDDKNDFMLFPKELKARNKSAELTPQILDDMLDSKLLDMQMKFTQVLDLKTTQMTNQIVLPRGNTNVSRMGSTNFPTLSIAPPAPLPQATAAAGPSWKASRPSISRDNVKEIEQKFDARISTLEAKISNLDKTIVEQMQVLSDAIAKRNKKKRFL